MLIMKRSTVNSIRMYLVLKMIKRRAKRERNCYIRPLFMSRVDQSERYLLSMLNQDSYYHHRYFRMDKDCFSFIYEKVEGKLRCNINHAFPISPIEKLVLTMRYLASGNSQVSLCYSFRLSPSSCSKIIRETLLVLKDVLEPDHLPSLKTSDFKLIAEDFEKKWNFPNACGSVDGKHIRIKCPNNSGSAFFNYKKYYSIVLFAVADANYRFIMVDIGTPGSQSDAGILTNSQIRRIVENSENILPEDRLVSNFIMPYVFLGDEAFQLQKHMLRPYPGKFIEKEKRIFNYRLSRARLVVENSFGILAARWRVLHTAIHAEIETTKLIINVCVLLHNYLVSKNDFCSFTTDKETENGLIEGSWRSENRELDGVQKLSSNNYKKSAFEIRELLKNYFNSPDGALPWQDKRALI